MSQNNFISGCGAFCTNQPGSAHYIERFPTLSVSDIEKLITNPQRLEKSKAQWSIFSNLQSRKHAEQLENGKYGMLWADLDNLESLFSIDVVTETVKALFGGVRFYVYSTASWTAETPKYRVLIPTKERLTGPDFVLCQTALNDLFNAAGLECDPVSVRPAQLCYLPNIPPSKDIGQYSQRIIGGELISPLSALSDGIAKVKADQEAKDEAHKASMAAARTKACERMSSGEKSPIDAYNASMCVELALINYGYIKRGKNYHSPNQSSSSAAVSVKDGKWFSHSSSDLISGIGKSKEQVSGCYGDAFDLYKFYECGNDAGLALKKLGDEFKNENGVSITKQNQISHRQNAAKNNAAAVFQGVTGGIPNAPALHDAPVIHDWNTVLYAECFCAPEHLSTSGRGLACVENIKAMLDVYGVSLAYNELSRRVEISMPKGAGVCAEHEQSEANAVTAIESLAVRCRISTDKIVNLIELLAARNSYNPVTRWIDSAPWDGVDRINLFINLFNTPAHRVAHRDSVMRRWLFAGYHMIGNTNALRRNQRNILTLKGAQNAGKTKIMGKLLGEMNRYLLEGQTVDPHNKDMKELIAKHWLVELGELGSTMRKSDTDALKAFVTMDSDTFRPAYGRVSIAFPRKAFFYATVNDDEFLKDTTGNTRFQIVEIESLNAWPNDLCPQQIWAQVKHEYNAELAKGYSIPCELTPEELTYCEEVNETFRSRSTEEEILLNWKDSASDLFMNKDLKPIEIVEILNNIGHRSNPKAVGIALQKLGYTRASKNAPYRNVRVPTLSNKNATTLGALYEYKRAN